MLLSGVDNPDSIQVDKGSMFNAIVFNCILQRYLAFGGSVEIAIDFRRCLSR